MIKDNAPSLLGRFRIQTSGTAAAEMALMMPLVLVLIFACLETGHFFYTEHRVIKGVRDAARYAARQDLAAFPCSAAGAGFSLSDANLEDNIVNVARSGTPAGGQPRISTWTDENPNTQTTVSYACVDTGDLLQGIYRSLDFVPLVSVSATVQYDSLFNALGVLDSSYSLHARNEAPVTGI